MSFIGLGSVSDYCLHNAKAPVLLVHFQHGKQPAAAAVPEELAPAPPPAMQPASAQGLLHVCPLFVPLCRLKAMRLALFKHGTWHDEAPASAQETLASALPPAAGINHMITITYT